MFSRNGIYYYDPTGYCPNPNDAFSPINTKPTGDQITWIGDSYTEGAETYHIITKKLSGVDIRAQVGKHFVMDAADDAGGDSGMTILEKMGKSHVRKYLVFALGTNDPSESRIKKNIKKIVDDYLADDGYVILVTPWTLKAKNDNSLKQGYEDVAKQMVEVSKANKYKDRIAIADWASVGQEHDEYYDSGKIHLTQAGYQAWFDLIYDALPGGVNTVSGDSNQAVAWNYLISKNIAGVSDNAAVLAGLIGNFEGESGTDPFMVSDNGIYHGMFQVSKEYYPNFHKSVEAKFGNKWHRLKQNSIASKEEQKRAIEFELDFLVNEYEPFKEYFLKNLNHVALGTAEGYSDLFLVTVERAYADAVGGPFNSTTELKDSGVCAVAQDIYKNSSKVIHKCHWQSAASRRENARKILKKFTTNSTTAFVDNGVGNILANNHNPKDTVILPKTTVSRKPTVIKPDQNNKSTVYLAANNYQNHISTSPSHLSNVQKDWIRQNHDIAEKWSIAYGIPWEVPMAQSILESSDTTNHIPGNSKLARNKHNYFGIGAYAHNGKSAYENAITYDSPEAGWQGYFENIRKSATYRNHGVFQNNAITDPMAYLVAICDAGYASPCSSYVSSTSRLVLAIQQMAADEGWDSSEQLAAKHPEMLEHAAEYAAGANAPPVNLSSSSAADCGGNGSYNNPTNGEFIWYCQRDYPNVPWGSFGTISSSGCGPTSFAMLATVLLARQITPPEIAAISGQYHVKGGADHRLTCGIAPQYGLECIHTSCGPTNQDCVNKINQLLDEGYLIHTSGKGSRPFTPGGHYIGIRGRNPTTGNWLIADPSSYSYGKPTSLSPDGLVPIDVVSAGMWHNNINAIRVKQ